MSAKIIKVAVIGAGNMGRNHIRTYSKMDNVEIVGVVDPNPDAAKVAKEYGVPFFQDYAHLAKKGVVDAVSIVVPTHLHHQIGMEFMKNGVHCLVEKPIASGVEEAEELISLAKRQGVIFTVGHIERFNPMIRKLKKLVDAKEIGEITSIITRRVGGFPAMEPKTDVIVDLAVHDIDVISYLLGRQPEHIYGHGSTTLHSHKLDSAELLLDYGAASGFVQANWITPVKVRNIAVTGTKGYVEGNYITQELIYYKHSMHRENDGFKNFVSSFGEPERYHISEDPREPLAIELQAFIDRINGDEDAQIVPPADARNALAVVLEAIDGTLSSMQQQEPMISSAPKQPTTKKKGARL